MLALLGSIVVVVALSPPVAEVRDRTDRLFAGDRYQKELPPRADRPAATITLGGAGADQLAEPGRSSDGSAADSGDGAGSDAVPAGEATGAGPIGAGELRQREREREIRRREKPGWLGPTVQTVVLVLALAVVALLAMAIASRLGGSGAEVAATEPVSARDPPDDELVTRPLDDAERLAAEGRFSEAIHLLLLRTLDELRRRSGRPIPRALTSREIVSRVPVPEAARGELSGLVTAVELSRFGGAEAGAGDYDRCRESFRRFANAYVGAA